MFRGDEAGSLPAPGARPTFLITFVETDALTIELLDETDGEIDVDSRGSRAFTQSRLASE